MTFVGFNLHKRYINAWANDLTQGWPRRRVFLALAAP